MKNKFAVAAAALAIIAVIAAAFGGAIAFTSPAHDVPGDGAQLLVAAPQSAPQVLSK